MMLSHDLIHCEELIVIAETTTNSMIVKSLKLIKMDVGMNMSLKDPSL